MLQPKQKLYNQLKADGKYTKSYEDFENQFSTPEKQQALYDNLKKDGSYTKSIDDFSNQFFPVKKKDSTAPAQKSASTPSAGSSGLVNQPDILNQDLPSQKLQKNNKQEVKKTYQPKTTSSDATVGSMAWNHARLVENDPTYARNYERFKEAEVVPESRIAEIRQEVDDEINNVGFFNNARTFLAKGASMLPSWMGGTTGKDVDPLYKEKEQAEKELQQINSQARKQKQPELPITDEAIAERAKNIRINNKITSERDSQVRSLLTDMENETSGPGTRNARENLMIFQIGNQSSISEKDKQLLKKQNIIRPIIESSAKKLNDLQKEAKSYDDKGQAVPKELRSEIESTATAYQNQLKDAIATHEEYLDNRKDLGNAIDNLDEFKRDYSWMKNFEGNVLASTMDLLAGGAGAVDYINTVAPGVSPNSLPYSLKARDVARKFKTESDEVRNEIMKPVSVDDINSLEDFGKFISNTAVGQQVPIFISTATGVGGIAALGASATGNKFEEMQAEIANGEANYNEAQLAGIPLAFGATETLSAAVDGMLLKNAARTVRAATEPERKLIAKGFWDNLKNNATKIGGESLKGASIEGADEAGTQIAQNIIDRYAGDKENVNIFDGVKDASAAGAVMGAFIPFGGNIVSRAVKPFSADASVQNSAAEVQKFKEILANPDLSPVTRAITEKQLAVSEAKVEASLRKTVANMKDLSNEEFQEIVNLEKEQASLKSQAKALKNDTSITEDERTVLESKLQAEFNSNNDRRLEILNKEKTPATNEENKPKNQESETQSQTEAQAQGGEVVDGNDTNVATTAESNNGQISNPNETEASQENTTEIPNPNQINDASTQGENIATDGDVRTGSGELGAMGEGTGQTAETGIGENTQPAVDTGTSEGQPEVDSRVQEIEARRQEELTALENNPEAIEDNGSYYIPGANGVETSTDLINEKYDAEIAALPEIENTQQDESRPANFERKKGEKSIVNRIYEGETSENVRNVAEDLGLTYEVENQEQAQKSAKSFVEKVGVDKALNALRENTIKGAEKAFVYAEILDKMAEAADNAELSEQEEIQERYLAVLNEATNMFDQEARESGRFISALNRIYNTSKIKYSLSRQIDRYKAFNDGKIDDATLDKFKEADENIKRLEKEIEDTVKRAEEAEAALAMQNIVEAAERESRGQKTAKQKAKTLANKIRKAKITRPDAFNAATAGIVWDAAIEIVAKTIEAGGTLADAVQAGVNHIKKSKWYKGLNEDKKSAAISQFESALAETNTNEVVTVEDGEIRIPNSVIRTLVEMGVRDIDTLSQKILDMVSEEHPEITLRDIRDAITKYGKTINPTKDAIQKEINLMKRLGRLISAMEDVDQGNRPLRSGLQREKPTQQERQMQRDLREKMRDLPLDHAELDKEWKNTLETIKSRLRNQIEDLEKQIKEGEKRKPEKTPVEYDEEANLLRNKRDELRTLLDEMTGKPELTDEQKVQRAINQMERAIEKLQKQIDAGDIGFAPRPKPLSSAELDALKSVRENLANELNQMREEAGLVEERKLNQAKDRVQKRINELQEKIRNNDFAKKEPKPVKEDAELTKLRAEKVKWQEVYDREVYKIELKNRTPRQKAREAIVGALNIFRILKATGELSPVLIQGGIQTVNLAVRKPKTLAKAFQKLFVALGSARKAEQYDAEMKADPNYATMKAAKLALAEPDYKLELREEQFIGNYINNIWNLLGVALENISGKLTGVNETMPISDKIISLFKDEYKNMPKHKISEQFKNVNPLLALERGLTTYMNQLRMDRFNDGIKMLEMEGKNIADNKVDYEKVAAAINTLTGRANIGRLANISDILNTIFFSFRNTVSIVNQINPLWYVSLNPEWDKFKVKNYKPTVAQKLAVYDMIRFITITTSAMYLLQAAAGDDDEGNPRIEIETDPLSSDFMKMKQGNVRYDAFHGMIPMVVFFCRQYKGLIKSKGEVKELGSGIFTPTRWDLAINMGVNKLSPQAGIAYRFANTKVDKEGNRVTKFGEPYDVAKELDVTPIYIASLQEIAKEDPDAYGRFLAFMGVFGVNSQVYETKTSTKKKAVTSTKNMTEEAKKRAKQK